MLSAWQALPIALVLCIAPFALCPYLLYRAPDAVLKPGLFLLLWVCVPVLSLLVPAWATRRGIPALVACVLPTLGYLGLLLYRMMPVPGVLLASLVLAVVSASYGQERRKQAERKGK